ncbi:LacI family DNA-binding transcriptional regulator [Schumannella luteola]|uniref:LacI family DNA-binding transcriptional regulator n=1 Tax=Schumannella luteola TaxID=472059 RepID=UPI002483AB81|nr:LacI family DNA-binding transcriptional regulator [Schumannella luteola]
MKGREVVSIRDVADQAGVSIGTVSKYMNTPERVAPATKRRIAAAIGSLGYVRNEAARQLRAGASRLVMFVAMELNNPFFGEVADAMERRAALNDLYFNIACGNGDPERESRYIEMLVQQRGFGLLLSSGHTRQADFDLLEQRRIPTVLVDAYEPDPRFSSVSIDDTVGGRQAAQHLVEQGCRSIVFVGSDLHVRQLAARAEGARAAVTAAGGASFELFSTPERSISAGRAAARALLDRGPDAMPDGIFAANDLLAIGLVEEFTERGVRVPADVAIIGYDDIEFAAAASIPISSIHRPRESFGRTAIDLLTDTAERPAGAPGVSDIVIRPELIMRASSLRR